MCKEKAFTLAEVLITLVVIGIIAALTIPALITNIQDVQNRTAWRKAVADISQASKSLAMDNAGSLNGVFSNNNDTRDKYATYIAYVKKCDKGDSLGPDGCWHSQFDYLSGNVFDYWTTFTLTNYSRLVLNNGMLITFSLLSPNCTDNNASKGDGCVQVGIDVNGFKGPNTLGKDIFWGYVTEQGGFEAFGRQGDNWGSISKGCDLQANSSAYGFACAAQYLRQ